MKSRFLPLLPFPTLVFVCLVPAAEPALTPGADLKDFRTVETAVTTRVSRAAPQAVREPGHLGIDLASDPSGLPVVAGVEADSPAARGGLQMGDVIKEVAGQTVASAAALRELLRSKAPGEQFKLVLNRMDKAIDTTVTLGAYRPAPPASARPVLGVQVEPAEGGLRVERVVLSSPADKAGLKPGDLLLKANDTALTAAALLADVLGKVKVGDAVALALRRDGKDVEVTARLAGETAFNQGRIGIDFIESSYFKEKVYRLAVVLIEFPDVKHNEKLSPKEWDKALFSRGVYNDKSPTGQRVYGSLSDYYHEQSCGAFRLEGKVFDYVQVERKRMEYANEPIRGVLQSEALDKLIARDGTEALQGFKDKPFDGMCFVYTGKLVDNAKGTQYWPHCARLNHRGERWNYCLCPEGGERMSSISFLAHEFGHMLGLPDLYETADKTGSEGVGDWCTMSTGHGRDGKPLHFSAWCKEQLGWLKPAVIDPTVKQKLILAPVEDSAKECFKVLLRPDGSEYLLLENRARKGFDRDLPGEGLLIWRVVGDRPLLEAAHGRSGSDAASRLVGSVPYPSKANNAFTPYTTPSSKSSRDGLPVHITDIQRLPDGRITFCIGYEYL
jgi:M6 family metalloprotease-like protein